MNLWVGSVEQQHTETHLQHVITLVAQELPNTKTKTKVNMLNYHDDVIITANEQRQSGLMHLMYCLLTGLKQSWNPPHSLSKSGTSPVFAFHYKKTLPTF